MNEIWVSLNGVVECGEYYQVSNLGNIRSIDRFINNRIIKGQPIKTSLDRYGYVKVRFRNRGKVKNHSVHVLVGLAFIPNPTNKPQINHKDGNKQNNHVDNLEWCTGEENQQHAFKTGLNYNHNRKMSDKDINKAKELYNNGNYTYSKLAKIFNVSISTMYRNINK